MRPKIPAPRRMTAFARQSRLADAGLTAHENDVAGAPAERGVKDALELVEFGFAANEGASVRRHHGIAGDAASAARLGPALIPLSLHFSDQSQTPRPPSARKHALGQQCLTGSCGGHQSRCEIHEVAKDRIVMPVRATN